jgi:hypothetical protein
VLEHLSDAGAALRRANGLLMPGGRIIVYVPAGSDLYGTLDRGVGHQRRYDRDELAAKLSQAGFVVEEIGYQNQVGRLAWWLNSKVLRRHSLPSVQSRLFDFFVPLFRSIESDRPPSGLSLVAIGRKPAGAAAPAAVSA